MVAIRWPWPVMVPAKGELAYDEYHAEFGSSEGIESASSWTYNEDTSRIWALSSSIRPLLTMFQWEA